MRTKAELEYFISTKRLATPESLTQRELTESEIRRMPEPVYAWHEQNNRQNVAKALDAPRVKAERKRSAELEKTERQFSDNASAEETAAALEEVKKFISQRPQFRGDHIPNREILIEWLRLRNLPVTDANLGTAFEELGREGKLVLNPAAAGVIRIKTSKGQIRDICKEDLPVWQRRNGTRREAGKTVEIPVEMLPFEEITGRALTASTQLDRLLRPYSPAVAAQIAQDKLSADEFKKQVVEDFREANRERLIAEAAAEFEKVNSTWLSFHPEFERSEENRKHIVAYLQQRKMPYSLASLEEAYGTLVREGYIQPTTAVVQTQGTRLVDYGAEPRSKTIDSNDPSLAYEISKLSAAEYMSWLQNPENRQRIDSAVSPRG